MLDVGSVVMDGLTEMAGWHDLWAIVAGSTAGRNLACLERRAWVRVPGMTTLLKFVKLRPLKADFEFVLAASSMLVNLA